MGEADLYSRYHASLVRARARVGAGVWVRVWVRVRDWVGRAYGYGSG